MLVPQYYQKKLKHSTFQAKRNRTYMNYQKPNKINDCGRYDIASLLNYWN